MPALSMAVRPRRSRWADFWQKVSSIVTALCAVTGLGFQAAEYMLLRTQLKDSAADAVESRPLLPTDSANARHEPDVPDWNGLKVGDPLGECGGAVQFTISLHTSEPGKAMTTEQRIFPDGSCKIVVASKTTCFRSDIVNDVFGCRIPSF